MKTRFVISGIATIIFTCTCIAQHYYNIIDFGAIPDDSTVNTVFIQRAIDSCAASGGGTVYVPAGIFVTGTIELKSNVNLYLESGAELKGSARMADYKPYQSPLFNTAATYGIIYAHRAQNVSITGQGAINGNDQAFFYWDQIKTIEWGELENTRQKANFRRVESGIGDGPVVPKAARPRQMVIFSECKNVLVRDIQLNRSPFWTLHFADCDGVIASGLKVWASMETPNSDGIDITSCRNVMVSDCDIRTGDDAIAITGYAHHFELPGFHNLRHNSYNITITNCNLQSRSSGIRIGWIDQNSVKNVLISNVNITNSNRGIGIFVRDTGSIENITIAQVVISTRLHTGDWWGNGEPIHISAVRGNNNVKMGSIRNVTFRDVTCEGESGIILYGSEESRIKDVSFFNVKFTLRNSKLNEVAGGNIDLRGAYGTSLFAADISAFYAQYVDNLLLNQVDIAWDNVTENYFKHGIHVKEFTNLQLNHIKASPAPSNKHLPPIFLENGKGYKGDVDRKYVGKKNVRK
ncbi:MAG: glycoside hydrolase family 28 protein [Bacteroidales bacterium]